MRGIITTLFLTISVLYITPVLANPEEVNVYSARKGYLIKPLLNAFEKDTDIKVNIISGKAKALQKESNKKVRILVQIYC